MPQTKTVEIHQSVPGVTLTSENKCSYCTQSICCNYVNIEIDTPRSRADFDQLLWQVAHDNISFYKDEDGWFMTISSRCGFLSDRGECGIYDSRPTICREYTNEFCEFDEPAETHFDLHFRTHAELLAYCRQRFKRWDEYWQKQWSKQKKG